MNNIGNIFIEIINKITNLIVIIFQWFFNFFNQNPLLKYFLIALVAISLLNVIINIILGFTNEND